MDLKQVQAEKNPEHGLIKKPLTSKSGRYQKIGGSTTTPVELTKRKEILVKIPLVDYTLVYHYGDLDKTPVREVKFRATLSDGSQRLGTLDKTGRANLSQVPSGIVRVEYQYDHPEDDDPKVIAARQKLKKALDAIVAQTREDMKEEWNQWNEANWLTKQYLLRLNYHKGQAVGAWEWLSGTVQAVWQLAVLLNKVDREIVGIRNLIITGQWEAVDQKISDYRASGEKVLEAGGAAKELVIQILHDRVALGMIVSFGVDWWNAIPPDEQVELGASVGTQIGVDIAIAVLLSSFSFGAGGSTYGSAKWAQKIGELSGKIVRLLDRLKEAFEELAVALRNRRQKLVEVKKANTEKVIESQWKDSAAAAPVVAGEEYCLIDGKKYYPKDYSGLLHGTSREKLNYPIEMDFYDIVEDIYKNGLPERGQGLDLYAHVVPIIRKEESAFRGTTSVMYVPGTAEGSSVGAVYWAGDGGLVIRLKNVKGYDVNEMLEGRVSKFGGYGGNALYGENEIAVPSRIRPNQISKIYYVEKNDFGVYKTKEIPRRSSSEAGE